MSTRSVFIAGGTGYIGSRLIPELLSRGHRVTAVARKGSESKLPSGCRAVPGDVLNGDTYAANVAPGDTFVQLVGVAHPSPAKAKEFVSVDRRSAMEAIRVASGPGIGHFVYVSVAHPAPAMLTSRYAPNARKLFASPGCARQFSGPGTSSAQAITGLTH